VPDSYPVVLEQLKAAVRSAQVAALRAVNTELIELYWSIGITILAQQATAGWGAKVIDRLAGDLRAEFPHMRGFSRSNLYSMRACAASWPQGIVQTPIGQISWSHVVVLLEKLDDAETRNWYAAAAHTHGWSSRVLLNQIKNQTHLRVGAAPSNFAELLPAEDSELAQQLTKDPYVFDFLDLAGEVSERELEDQLMSRLQRTMAEFGHGFAFVGRQVHFEVGGEDFHIDLLFFHVTQLRYVVVELKIGKFKPNYLGQLGFYVALVDGELRNVAVHAPTVGILLCADTNQRVVQYALGGSSQAVAVATYTYDTLPAEVRSTLPTPEDVIAGVEAPVEHHGRQLTIDEYIAEVRHTRD